MNLYQRIFRNLPVKLISIAFLVIIPVNIIAVILMLMISDTYKERLNDSYQSQLHLYAMSINRDLEMMNGQLKNFLNLDTTTDLTLDSKTDSTVRQVRLDNKVKEIRGISSLEGMSYTWDPVKGIIGMFSIAEENSIAVQNQMKELLYQRTRNEGISTYNEIVSLNKDAYIVQHYDFPQFSFGFLFSVKYILESYYQSGSVGKDMMLFVNQGGDIEYIYSGGEDERNELADEIGLSGTNEYGRKNRIATLQELDTYIENSRYIMLKEDVASLNYTIVQVIDSSAVMEALPVFFTGLSVLVVISFLALPLLAYFIMRWIIKPMWRLSLGMVEVENGNLEYHLDNKNNSYQMEYIYDAFNHMVDEIRGLTIESYEKDIERLQTEAINMRLQVNPHMLLNFLNTIYGLAGTGTSAEVREFTLLLVEYFRYVLHNENALVPVKEEMDFVLNYLKIQKVRFPDSYISVYAIDDAAYEIMIPRLLIQNFVENCIKYALIMGSVVEILINIHVEKERLMISVCDTGNGMSEEKLASVNCGKVIKDRNGYHVGIWNCVRRLHLYYGDDFIFNVTSKMGEGTQVWMELPLEPIDPDRRVTDIYQRHREEQKT